MANVPLCFRALNVPAFHVRCLLRKSFVHTNRFVAGYARASCSSSSRDCDWGRL
jgi:hypothetical protein